MFHGRGPADLSVLLALAAGFCVIIAINRVRLPLRVVPMKRHLRVEQLEARDVPSAGSTLIPIGVGVDYTLSLNSSGRVATMQLAAPDYLNWLNGSITAAQVQAMTQRIYQYFPDQFDHILFVDNTPDVSPLSPYFGVTFGAKNETLGTGERLFNNTALFGSAGRLQTARSRSMRLIRPN